MYLKVGSFVLSTIIQTMVPSGKAYRSINSKYFMALIFPSLFIALGIFLVRTQVFAKPINTNSTTIAMIMESLWVVIQVIMSLNVFTQLHYLYKNTLNFDFCPTDAPRLYKRTGALISILNVPLFVLLQRFSY